MARLLAPLPLALISLLVPAAALAEGKAPSLPRDAKVAAKPVTKRAPTAMHTTPIAVPERPRTKAATLAVAAPTTDAKAAENKVETKVVAKSDAKDPKKVEATKPKPPCLREPVRILRGLEEDQFSLTRCDGSPVADGVARLSILARPGSAAKPTLPMSVLEKAPGQDLAPGIRKLEPKLAVLLQSVVDHFGKTAGAVGGLKVFVVSGYRPASAGSYHATGRALDFSIPGVRNEDLVAFCKTLPDAGCGYYPNSSFVHMDAREGGTGHVSWIDASGPGEPARYVSAWPPVREPDLPVDATAKLDLPALPADVTTMPTTTDVPIGATKAGEATDRVAQDDLLGALTP